MGGVEIAPRPQLVWRKNYLFFKKTDTLNLYRRRSNEGDGPDRCQPRDLILQSLQENRKNPLQLCHQVVTEVTHHVTHTGNGPLLDLLVNVGGFEPLQGHGKHLGETHSYTLIIDVKLPVVCLLTVSGAFSVTFWC